MSTNSDVLPKILTIGTFDGVHIGHQKILEKVKQIGEEYNLTPSVLTFFPHPRMVLNQDDSIKLLNTISERKELLEYHGIKLIYVKTFTKAFANLSANAYVKGILIDELNAKNIVIGYDHKFGKDRSASIDDLIKYSNEYNFKVIEISVKEIEEITVSSTKIRNALLNGNVKLANKLLGYHYFFSGKVVLGQKIGRSIGFPTANIFIEEDYKLIPKDGVYVIKSLIGGVTYYGMMNIGSNPTFKNKPRSIEVHFFEFDHDIYGKQLKIEMLSRLRDEEKFNTPEGLKSQLEADKVYALDYIKILND